MSDRYTYVVRFLAAWLLSSLILGVAVGWTIGVAVGLIIAVCYIGAIRMKTRPDADNLRARSQAGTRQAEIRRQPFR